jgi:hypothetical protein
MVLEWKEMDPPDAWSAKHNDPERGLFFSFLTMETETSGGWFTMINGRSPLGSASVETPPLPTPEEAREEAGRRFQHLLAALGLERPGK